MDDYTDKQTVKGYLMRIKEKDGVPLFVAVEFVKYNVTIGERGVVYFHQAYKQEVLMILNCSKFWNNLKIVKPTLSRKPMYNKLEMIAVEFSNDWNVQQKPLKADIREMLTTPLLQFQAESKVIGNTIWNGDWPMIVGGVDHRITGTQNKSNYLGAVTKKDSMMADNKFPTQVQEQQKMLQKRMNELNKKVT